MHITLNMSAMQISQNDNKRQNRFKFICIRSLSRKDHSAEKLKLFFLFLRFALPPVYLSASEPIFFFHLLCFCLCIKWKKLLEFSMCVAYSCSVCPTGETTLVQWNIWEYRQHICLQNLIPLNAEVTFFSSPFKNKQMTRHIGYIRAVLCCIFSTFSVSLRPSSHSM